MQQREEKREEGKGDSAESGGGCTSHILGQKGSESGGDL
jgi:hypothetical protein